MITYEPGHWGVTFAFDLTGSVVPKALAWSVSSSVVAFIINLIRILSSEDPPEVPDGASFFIGYYFVCMAFLIVFRTQIAYKRFWDGVEGLNRIKGTWYNAYSSLIAFTSRDEKKADEVLKFKHLLVRLVSMLHCEALKQIAVRSEENFEILDCGGLSAAHMEYISHSSDKCEVALQCIQQLIVDSSHAGVINIAPPILSRVFQELSNGIVETQQCKTITTVPFPYPYAQTLTLMLLGTTGFVSLMSGLFMSHPLMAAIGAFALPFAFWSINYIAQELEMPFGDDPNDINIPAMQISFNRSLVTLLEPLAASTPGFDFDAVFHGQKMQEIADDKIAEEDIWKSSSGKGLVTEKLKHARKSMSSVKISDVKTEVGAQAGRVMGKIGSMKPGLKKSDSKQALTANPVMTMEVEAAPESTPTAQLQTMKVSQLKHLAKDLQVAVEKVHDCDDADNPKAFLIALIIDAQAADPPVATKLLPAAPAGFTMASNGTAPVPSNGTSPEPGIGVGRIADSSAVASAGVAADMVTVDLTGDDPGTGKRRGSRPKKSPTIVPRDIANGDVPVVDSKPAASSEDL